jgi:hypothetical protein
MSLTLQKAYETLGLRDPLEFELENRGTYSGTGMYRRTGVTTHVLVEALLDMILYETTFECERAQPRDRDFMVVFPSKGSRDYADNIAVQIYEKLGGLYTVHRRLAMHRPDGCENLILTTPDQEKRYTAVPNCRVFYDPAGNYDIPAPMRYIRQIIILPDEDGYEALDRDGNLICLFNKRQVIDFMKMGKTVPVDVYRNLHINPLRRRV